MRLFCTLAALAVISISAAGPASAADPPGSGAAAGSGARPGTPARPRTAAPAGDETPVVRPCPAEVVSGVRASLGIVLSRTSPIICRIGRTQVRGEDGTAGTAPVITAEAFLSDGRTARLEMSPQGAVLSTAFAHSDLSGSSGKGMALLFWVFALISVGGALFVISRRNLIAAVMGMVGSFLGIAAIYMMLYAQFLAVVQMLVYAGANMVLFVFVVMILNRPEDEPVAPTGRAGQALGGIAILYLVARLIMLLVQVRAPSSAAAAPPPTAEGYDWGSVHAVGTDLFGPGLFPFEAISIVLLLAVVGAIAIARPLHTDDDAPARTREEGAA
jgi:NADH-quinone oxidoreductase subunit J